VGVIRVGVVGASATRGWARMAHVPAVRAMPDRFELAAVATRDRGSAQLAGQQYGVRSFGDPAQLIASPDIDMVIIAVKVPHHADLLAASAAAGKDVLCEWPFARNVSEAEEMASLAQAAGRRVAVGLQGRFAPQVIRARELITEGQLGRLTSITAYSGLHYGYTGTLPDEQRWTLEPGNGATMLTVVAGHLIDVIMSLAGPIETVSGLLATQQPSLRLVPSGDIIHTTAPDHALVTGITESGVLVSLTALSGKAADARTVIEIEGTRGTLRLSSPLPVQLGPIHAELATGEQTQLTPLPVPAAAPPWAGELSHAAANVAYLLRSLTDPNAGTVAADEREALALHRLLETIGGRSG
jgi:predicted dehydrogenase